MDIISMAFTGRMFVCASRIEIEVEDWKQHFKLYEVYCEAFEDAMGQNLNDDDTLLMYTKEGDPFYVDKDCFQLVSSFMPIYFN